MIELDSEVDITFMEGALIKDFMPWQTMRYTMTGRVGFACKYMYEDQNLKPKQLKEVQQPLNFRGTIKWLRENQSLSQEKVYELIIHNLDATEKLVDYVSSLPIQQRMLRLGSDMLPAYTEPTFGHLSKTNYITTIIADRLNTIGEKARANDVRLSMHPVSFVFSHQIILIS